MLIAEDLLLLLLDDTSGRFLIDGTALDLGLAGAMLLELAERERLTVAGEREEVKAGRLKVVSSAPTGDAALDEALRRCADTTGKKPEAVLSAVGKGLRVQLLERLAAAGILRAEQGKMLGVFPTTRWPAVDMTHELAQRELLRSVLCQGISPDPRTAALAALLSAVDAPHKVLAAAGDQVDKKAVRRRAKEIRERAWAADAVGKAIDAVQAAVMAGVTASIVAASVAGGSGG